MEIDIDIPLTTDHNYVESVDMHGMVDVVLEKGSNSNTNVQSHVSHHLTPSAKQPTWTRIVRPQSYEGMDTLGGQIQHGGHKREFADSESLDSRFEPHVCVFF